MYIIPVPIFYSYLPYWCFWSYFLVLASLIVTSDHKENIFLKSHLDADEVKLLSIQGRMLLTLESCNPQDNYN